MSFKHSPVMIKIELERLEQANAYHDYLLKQIKLKLDEMQNKYDRRLEIIAKNESSIDNLKNIVKAQEDAFNRFVSERIRLPITDDDKLECRVAPVETNRIRLKFIYWRKETQRKENKLIHLTNDEMLSRLKTKYGEPESGKFWSQFIVFGSDEDVKEWDDEHAEENLTPANPTPK